MTGREAAREPTFAFDGVELDLSFDADSGLWRAPTALSGAAATRITVTALALPARSEAFDAMIAKLVGRERAIRAIAGPPPDGRKDRLLLRILEHGPQGSSLYGWF